MKHFPRRLAVTLALLAFAATGSAREPENAPATTIREFYRWYLEALAAEENPLEQTAKMNHFATSRLLKEIERLSTVESDMDGGGLDHDPIICAQDFDKEWAQNITVRDVQTVKEKATATVEFRGTSFADHQLKVALVKEDEVWKVDRVDPAD